MWKRSTENQYICLVRIAGAPSEAEVLRSRAAEGRLPVRLKKKSHTCPYIFNRTI